MQNTTPKICHHLSNVLDYLWQDERRDFEDRPPTETGPHIFESLAILDQWLQEQLGTLER